MSDRVDELGAVTSGLQDAPALMAAHDLGVFGALLGGPLDARPTSWVTTDLCKSQARGERCPPRSVAASCGTSTP